MSRREQGRALYAREEPDYERFDRRGRRPDRGFEPDYDYARQPRGPPAAHGGEMERFNERRRGAPPLYSRRSTSAGPMVLSSRREQNDYPPGEADHIHEHEEVHMPSRGRRARSPPAGEWDRDQMYLKKTRPREDVLEEEEPFGRYRMDEQPRRRNRVHETEIDRDVRPGRRRDELGYHKMSYERERSRPRVNGSEEAVYSRERTRGRPDSMSSEESAREPSPVHAPPIHQDVVTHHKHIEHGYNDPDRRRKRERNPRDDYERNVEFTRHREPEQPLVRTVSPNREHPPSREHARDLVAFRERDNRRSSHSDLRDEASYYNRIATENAPMGEAYHGATRDWSIVDVPPGTKRLTMDGAGGGSQEISWQRYNGVRRSKFMPSGADEHHDSRLHTSQSQGNIARRYAGVKDKREELWTEITKDLVVKEALERAGYDYEETEYFYYVFSYLKYDDVAWLVRLSDDYRRARRDRIREIQRERAILEEPAPRHRALPEPSPPRTVYVDRGGDRVVERDTLEEFY